MKKQHLWVVLASIFSMLFTYLVLNRPTGEHRVYFLPDLVVGLTIIVPYVYAWYRGLQGSYHLYMYRRKVHGLLYKSALGVLTTGIIITVVTSVLLQILAAVSASLNRLNLTPILAIIYLLVFIIGVSFILIAIGARRLQKIEEA